MQLTSLFLDVRFMYYNSLPDKVADMIAKLIHTYVLDYIWLSVLPRNKNLVNV